MPRWTKVILIVFVVMLFIVAGLLMAGNYYLNKIMPPQQRAVAQAFLNQIVIVPPDWQQIKPFPVSLVNEVYDADAEYLKLSEKAGTPGTFSEEISELSHRAAISQLTPEETTSATAVLGNCHALIAIVTRLSNEKDYDASVFNPVLRATDDFRGFMLMNVGTKLLCLEARMAARATMCDEALSSSLAALRLARRHPASEIITHLMCIAIESISCRCIESVADSCDSSEALRRTLDEMDKLSLLVNLDNLSQSDVLDIIGGLRAHGREGYPVNLQSGQPMSAHFDSLWLARQRIDDWALHNLPQSDPRTAIIRRRLAANGNGTAPSMPGINGIQLPFIRDIIRERFGLIARPDFTEAGIREQAAQVRFELARVAVARSLAKIQAGDKATSETVSSLLGRIPRDPFGKGAMAEETTRPLHFYSVGPDGVDDRAQVSYDPTNGTISPGDIY